MFADDLPGTRAIAWMCATRGRLVGGCSRATRLDRGVEALCLCVRNVVSGWNADGVIEESWWYSSSMYGRRRMTIDVDVAE